MRYKLSLILLPTAASLYVAACDTRPEPRADTACELRVAWDPYEPYSYSDGAALPVGYDIDVVTKIADAMDCSLRFTEMAWNDILVALENGETDITVGTGYKPERGEWSWYSESYRNEVIGLMIRAGTADRFSGNSLDEVLGRGLVLGKTTDDTYDASLEALFAKFEDQLHPRASEETNIKRLLDRSIDGFLVEVYVGAALAARLGVTDTVEFHPLEFEAGEYRLQMSKKTVSAGRVAMINASIQQLSASGWLTMKMDSYSMRADDIR